MFTFQDLLIKSDMPRLRVDGKLKYYPDTREGKRKCAEDKIARVGRRMAKKEK